MSALTWYRRIIAAATLALLVSRVTPAYGSDLDWMVAPYLWAPSIGTDVRTGEPPVGTDTRFPDLIDKLDGAFQIHAEGQGEHLGVFTDLTYLALADSKSFQRSDTRSELSTYLFELAGVWNPGNQRALGPEFFAGIRHVEADLTFHVDPRNPGLGDARFDVDESYTDVMLGIRYNWALGEHWRLSLRGDGSWGSTEGTWNASGVMQRSTSHGIWLFGYRYLSVDLEEGGNDIDISMRGPMVGFGFTF